MAVDWIKDDGAFADGWRDKALPADLKSEPSLADFKDVPGLAKAFVDTKKAMGQMVKLPDTPDGKREVLTKHFKDVLDADAAAAKKAADDAKAAADEAAKVQKAKDAQTALETSQASAKKVLGGDDAKAVETNTELARRAFRGDKCPQWIRELTAKAAGVEPDKLTDDQIKLAIASDPAVAQTLLTIGNLTRDGKLESGDGHTGGGKDERYPAYPYSPEVYAKSPDTDPEKKWFMNRGAEYKDGRYLGGYGGQPKQ